MKKNQAPAVHIAPEHQSAPALTWADKEVLKAAEEISSGQFQVDLSDGEFFDAGPTQYLAQHPRVLEMMEKLKLETREAKNTQEMIEKTQMLHEMNERASQESQWDGQGRWIGKENEEMRIGKILTPFEFMDKLRAVIGHKRVLLNRFSVHGRCALLTPSNEPSATNLIVLPGQLEPPKKTKADEFAQVGTLQYPCGTEWMVMRIDEFGCPTTAKYLGWRTALLSMIMLGVITEKEAHKAFPLKEGPASKWYRQQLYYFRNRKEVTN